MKAYNVPYLPIRVYRNEYGCHNQENDWKKKTGNQEDKFAVSNIMRSIDNHCLPFSNT